MTDNEPFSPPTLETSAATPEPEREESPTTRNNAAPLQRGFRRTSAHSRRLATTNFDRRSSVKLVEAVENVLQKKIHDNMETQGHRAMARTAAGSRASGKPPPPMTLDVDFIRPPPIQHAHSWTAFDDDFGNDVVSPSTSVLDLNNWGFEDDGFAEVVQSLQHLHKIWNGSKFNKSEMRQKLTPIVDAVGQLVKDEVFQQDERRRMATILEQREELTKLCMKLAEEPTNYADENWETMSLAQILDSLRNTLLNLRQEVEFRESQRTELHQKLKTLLDELGEEDEEELIHDDVSLDYLKWLEEKIARLNKIKNGRVRSIRQLTDAINKLWTQIGYNPIVTPPIDDERATLFKNVYNWRRLKKVGLLGLTIVDINRLMLLKEEFTVTRDAKRAKTMKLRQKFRFIKKREELWKKMKDIEKSYNNPKRLFGNSQTLHSDEQLRKTAYARLLTMEAKLRPALLEWQTMEGAPYMVQGKDYLKTLDHEIKTRTIPPDIFPKHGIPKSAQKNWDEFKYVLRLAQQLQAEGEDEDDEEPPDDDPEPDDPKALFGSEYSDSMFGESESSSDDERDKMSNNASEEAALQKDMRKASTGTLMRDIRKTSISSKASGSRVGGGYIKVLPPKPEGPVKVTLNQSLNTSTLGSPNGKQHKGWVAAALQKEKEKQAYANGIAFPTAKKKPKPSLFILQGGADVSVTQQKPTLTEQRKQARFIPKPPPTARKKPTTTSLAQAMSDSPKEHRYTRYGQKGVEIAIMERLSGNPVVPREGMYWLKQQQYLKKLDTDAMKLNKKIAEKEAAEIANNTSPNPIKLPPQVRADATKPLRV
eukprot:TRINITY_DN60842_c0_g1_i1.p1 TRINITY_DN60842_c0_g1~~TRINITY_DN60842_c0_g1_i1.p1  ORF type:complete len:820 (-),score=121.78 TRINITY_DN60842_c0_g1_i1:269-2728(-)